MFTNIVGYKIIIIVSNSLPVINNLNPG